MDFFVNLLFAHIVADYFFQPLWMAVGKSEKGFHGMMTCTLHCLLYAAIVGNWTTGWVEDDVPSRLLWIAFLFLSHYPVDRWSLADWWLRQIGGRNYRKYRAGHSTGRSMALEGGFYAVVYTVTDNAIHLMVAYYGMRLFASPDHITL